MTKPLDRNVLTVWKDVIFAIFIRELQSRFNDKFGLSWLVLEPLLYILLLSLIRSRISGNEVHGIPIFIFMLYGLLFIRLFTETINSTATSLRKDKPLYAFRQVQPISSVLAAMLIELMSKIGVFALLLLAIYLIEVDFNLDDGLLMITIFLTLWIFSAAIGLLFGIGTAFVPELDKVRTLITRPLFFISGVFFSLQDIPQAYWHWLTWNPVLHAIELARFSSYEGYGQAGVSLFYLAIMSLCFTFFALACYQLTWKRTLSR
ncbi:ABC transporter permease [Aestuariibacter salexigens]|uniref:ABC transporter permease n=1 Tax=Aestuariibacter salexigens TaxID=226010 RepID=UPI0004217B24|nr:ABC transporter permease [Aestuariibacter salexigens]